jgi:16S rRNA processing protein RimM
LKTDSSNQILLGKVLRPHGLGGLLRIASYAESPDSFLASGRVFMKDRRGVLRQEEVLSVQPHKGAFLMKLKGVETIEQAEELRSASIFVDRISIGQKEEGEFFWDEIIGLEVYLKTGAYVGEIKNIVSTGSNDIYVIRNGESEVLVPAIHDVVDTIDVQGGKMVITNMEGLLDLNEA